MKMVIHANYCIGIGAPDIRSPLKSDFWQNSTAHISKTTTPLPVNYCAFGTSKVSTLRLLVSFYVVRMPLGGYKCVKIAKKRCFCQLFGKIPKTVGMLN